MKVTIAFPVTPVLNLLFPFYISHQYSSLGRTKARESWTEGTPCFCIATIQRETSWLGIVGHQLAEDSLSWINCKKRQKSPKLLNWSPSGGGVAKCSVCNDKLLPSTGPVLKTSLRWEAGSPTPQTCCSRERLLLIFNYSGFENQSITFISSGLTFAKMTSV